MKQLLKLVIESLQISLLARLIVIANMSFCFLDCATLFYKLYSFSFQMIGLSFFIFSYFVILYWKKIKKVGFNKRANLYLLILRVFIFVLLISPLAFDSQWHILTTNEIDGRHGFEMLNEVIKIIGIEIALEILYHIEHTMKQNKSPFHKTAAT